VVVDVVVVEVVDVLVVLVVVVEVVVVVLILQGQVTEVIEPVKSEARLGVVTDVILNQVKVSNE